MLKYMEEANDFYFDSVSQIRMDRWSNGRVALLGDAGYCASPMSGMGTSMAVTGAYILAGELMEADGNYARAFARYEQNMRPFVAAAQKWLRAQNGLYLQPVSSYDEPADLEDITAYPMEKYDDRNADEGGDINNGEGL